MRLDDDAMASMHRDFSRWFRRVAESTLGSSTRCLINPHAPIRDEEIEELDHLSAQARSNLITFMEALSGEHPPNTGPPDGNMADLDVPAEPLAHGCFRFGP